VGVSVTWSPCGTGVEQGIGETNPDINPHTHLYPWREPLTNPDAPPVQPLSPTVLRSIPWGWFQDRARENASPLTTLEWAMDSWAAGKLGLDAPPPPGSAPFDTVRRRKHHLDDEHYKTVAAIYRAALVDPKRRKTPTKAVQEHFTVAKPTAARWVMECRRRGLLDPTTRGRAAGKSTEHP
jgi:hypothetical protein